MPRLGLKSFLRADKSAPPPNLQQQWSYMEDGTFLCQQGSLTPEEVCAPCDRREPPVAAPRPKRALAIVRCRRSQALPGPRTGAARARELSQV